MLTKPAAAFAQILGAILMFIGFGAMLDGSYGMLIVGALLFVWGGLAVRKRIADDRGKEK